MPNNLLFDHYAGRRAETQRQIDTITQLAFNRDDHALSDQDREQLGVLQTELAGITRDIEALAVNSELSDQARAAMDTSGASRRNIGHQYRSEAEALWDIFHRSTDEGARYRWQQLTEQTRAAEHMGTKAADTTPTAGGFDGLIVVPSVGPVLRLQPTSTPFLSLIGPQAAPNGFSFTRPRIVDPDFGTAAAPQGLQKAELASKKFDIKSDTVDMVTIGNYLNISYQLLEWIPQSLQTIVDQLRLRVEYGLELAAVAEADKTTAIVTLPPASDAAATQAAVWEAMADVFIATHQPATWLACGPKGMAMLGSTVDLANRPLFPFVGAANALGTASSGQIIAPFGLQFAQTHAIDDTTIYVGNGVGLEAYLYRFPMLEAVEPSLLGRQISVAASVGWFHPTTTEAVTGGSPAPAKFEAIVAIKP